MAYEECLALKKAEIYEERDFILWEKNFESDSTFNREISF